MMVCMCGHLRLMVCMCGHLRYAGFCVWTLALWWFGCVDTGVMKFCMCGNLRYDGLYVWTIAL